MVKKGKFNRVAFGLARQLRNLNCAVCLRGVTAGLAHSPGLLICVAHLSSAGALKFPLTHWGVASHTQHKRKERRGEGKKGKILQNQQTVISLSPPLGHRYLSVKSQVTTLLAEPSEGRHLINRSPACLASIEIRKGKKIK